LQIGGEADGVYLLSLAAQGRQKKAADFLQELKDESAIDHLDVGTELMDEMAREGLGHAAAQFFRDLLTVDPALPLWDAYVYLSGQSGHAQEALAFVREISGRAGLLPAAQESVNGHLADALLAADDLDEGIAILRKMIKADAPDQNAGASACGKDPLDRCLQLARIGTLVGRKELFDEGVAAAKKSVAEGDREDSDSGALQLVEFLISVRRFAEAEALIVDEEARPVRDDPAPKDLCLMLALDYDRAGRYADVKSLMDHSTQWGGSDISDLQNADLTSTDSHVLDELIEPLMAIFARALLNTGAREEGRKALERLIETHPGYDPGYELLLAQGGDGIEALLDQVAGHDRFEERPLIWKARLQMDAGRLDEAEKNARAAIAIDPSDGEQGKGARMRAYAVLADVLEKKGEADQAKTLRGVVEAIRLSEQGDDWWQAGLLTRAIKIYEQALGHFADAYCIQSRLALRYNDLGDYEKAAHHYERAFELMPESFGRVESHCFGCEGIFGGPAQDIAGRVFERLAEKMPKNPRVFYLLGYLRQEQGRNEEALGAFRNAVKLDPDYYNAWDHMLQFHEEGLLSPEEADVAFLTLLRLDPAGHRQIMDFGKIRNLRAVWDLILKPEKENPPFPQGPIYPLAASKAMIQERMKWTSPTGRHRHAEIQSDETKEIGTQFLRSHFAKQPLFKQLDLFISGD
jgi:tetratricopeptide (TPR) repeat protein